MAIPENRGFQKMEILFFSAENNSMWTSFGKKLSHSTGDYKNVKTCGQCMSLTEKTEFYFFHVPIFRYCRCELAFRHGHRRPRSTLSVSGTVQNTTHPLDATLQQVEPLEPPVVAAPLAGGVSINIRFIVSFVLLEKKQNGVKF